ncbi:MAG: lipid-A-disaccharide synthase [Bacteroidia bacterium]
MKYYLIAGEASGDLHASNLMKELKKGDAAAQFRCWGGDLMKSQGGDLIKHYHDLAFMGFTEVLMNISTIKKNIDFCKKDILAYQPDVLILVDYPGFNLRIAEFAHAKRIKIFYYISPQVWAWKQSRVHKIKRIVDKMFVILPFEKKFYEDFQYEVEYVGHPLLDAVSERNEKKISQSDYSEKHQLSGKPIVALLPGSRKHEITKMLPIMLSVAEKFKEYQFVIAAAPSVPLSFYESFIKKTNAKIIYNQTYSLLEQSTAAIVTSGTATLETALFNIPEVVCYKGSAISFFIARNLVKVKYISLVNLIMDKMVVKELIQQELTVENLQTELQKLLHDVEYKNTMLAHFTELKKLLGDSGASAKTAHLMLDNLTKQKSI